jgi:hypothetical protein
MFNLHDRTMEGVAGRLIVRREMIGKTPLYRVSHLPRGSVNEQKAHAEKHGKITPGDLLGVVRQLRQHFPDMKLIDRSHHQRPKAGPRQAVASAETLHDMLAVGASPREEYKLKYDKKQAVQAITAAPGTMTPFLRELPETRKSLAARMAALKPKGVTTKAWRKGVEHEAEHQASVPTKVGQAKIAADHLEEDPQYYDKLATIEKSNAGTPIRFTKVGERTFGEGAEASTYHEYHFTHQDHPDTPFFLGAYTHANKPGHIEIETVEPRDEPGLHVNMHQKYKNVVGATGMRHVFRRLLAPKK